MQISAYGGNVNAAVNVNADHGWGGYQYPGGVPAGLLGVAIYGDIRVTVRVELVELFSLALQLAHEKHGYTVHTSVNGENWGPWGYENRVIAGSNTPSNHSRGKASDWNAPNNPYATGSKFSSDFPPAMVADLESIGLCWGGRYGDAMHWEYGYAPGDVALHVAKARALLAGGTRVTGRIIADTTNTADTTATDAPVPPTTEDDDMPYTPEQLVQFSASGFARAIQQEAVIDFEGSSLTLEHVIKILTDRQFAITQKLGA